MNNPLWTDPGTWIAVGVTVLTLVVAFAMHRVIRKVLQQNTDTALDNIEKSATKNEANSHE